MTLMSLIAYAETHASSRQAATKWRDRGYLVMENDQVDVERSDAKLKPALRGRFRMKAHGGRRAPGRRGMIDRPAGAYIAGVEVGEPAPSASKTHPWEGWAWAGNADNPLSKTAFEVLAIGGDGVGAEIAEIIDHSEWEIACTHLGWHRWPALIAADLASELGLVGKAGQVQDALAKLVDDRLFGTLESDPADFADSRLEAR